MYYNCTLLIRIYARQAVVYAACRGQLNVNKLQFEKEIRYLLSKIRSFRRQLKRNCAFPLTTLPSSSLQLNDLIESAKSKYVNTLINKFCDNPRKLYEHLSNISHQSYLPEMMLYNAISLSSSCDNAKLVTSILFYQQFLCITTCMYEQPTYHQVLSLVD